jgi:plasmid stabilization system protein ParE
MRIEITDFAKSELQKIYNYYQSVASDVTALKVIERILDAIEVLERTPNLGTAEQLLESLQNKYFYIVSGNYKIIFYRTIKVIFITDIFDCRQNPKKILDRNK